MQRFFMRFQCTVYTFYYSKVVTFRCNDIVSQQKGHFSRQNQAFPIKGDLFFVNFIFIF